MSAVEVGAAAIMGLDLAAISALGLVVKYGLLYLRIGEIWWADVSVIQLVGRVKVFTLFFSRLSFEVCCSGGFIYDQLGFLEQYTIF